MAEFLEMPCPSCAHPLRVHQQYFGKRLACKYCKHTFKVAGDAPIPPGAEVEDLRNKVASLEEELRQARGQCEAAETARQAGDGERKRLQDELQQALAQMHGLQTEQERNERALLDAASMQPQLQAAQADCERLQAELVGLRLASEGSLADARSECQRIQGEIDALRSTSERELADAKSEAARLSAELAETHTELDATTLARDRAEALAEKLHRARSEASATASRLQNESQAAIEKLRADVAARQQALADAAASLEDARKQWEGERASLQTTWEREREDEARSWQEEIQAAEQRYDDERRALMQKNQEAIGSLAAERDQLATRREELEQSLRQARDEAQQERAAVRGQMDALERRDWEANACIADLRRELQTAQAALAELQNRQTDAVNGESEKCKELEKELARCRQELSLLQQTCRSYGLDFGA